MTTFNIIIYRHLRKAELLTGQLNSDSIPKLISALDKLAQEGRLVTRTTSKGMTEYRYNNEAPHECNCPDCPSNL